MMKDSKDFLLHSASLLNWGDLSGKVVMDVGCGNGRKSTNRLTQLFPNMKKLVGIDQCPTSISAARSNHAHPKVEYHFGRIDHRPSMVEWEGKMQVIVSHFYFHCLTNQNETFANVYRLLAPGGSAAFRFLLRSNLYDWAEELGECFDELSDHYDKEPPESHIMNYQASHYIQILTDIGFNIVECEDEAICQQFETDMHCQRYLGIICPLTSKLPRSERESFRNEIFHTYLKYSTRDEQGLISIEYRTATILVTKPTSVE